MPYRAPGTEDARISWILREVQKAQSTLDESIAAAEALPASDLTKRDRLNRYKALKREVDTAFSGLDRDVAIWAERDIPSLYRSGWIVGSAQTGVGFDFTLPHREALDVLSYDAYDDVATRLQSVRQGFSDTVDLQELYENLSPEEIAALQAKSRSAVAQALLTGNADPKKVARSLAQDIWRDNPNLSIIDAGGKQWKMQTYTRMLIRTKSANAYNSGTLNKFAEEGVRRVQVFDGVYDKECANANGEVWSLRYAMNHPIAHPNCVRAFAAKPGVGEVNQDTETKGLVLFDRAELGVGALAAIRYFNRTGEINVSSTLARIAWELVEVGTFPMPLVDEFITGFAHLGLRELDGWIESYVDPVLYYAGLIQKVPSRAAIRKMNRPEQVLDAIATSIKEANLEAYGTEYHPQVRRITDNLARYGSYIESGVWDIRSKATDHVGGLKWVGPILAEAVDLNKLGQISAETLLRWRDGDDLVEAFRASEFVLEQFRTVKRLHLEASTAGHEDLLRVYDDLDRIGDVAARLLADEIDFEGADQIFVDVLKRYSITTDGANFTFQKRRLAELLDDVRRSQRQVLDQLDEYESVSRQRVLGLPMSSGADFPTHSASMWDADKFERAAANFAQKVKEAEPVFDGDSFDEFAELLRRIGNDLDSPLRERLLQNMNKVYTRPTDPVVSQLLHDNPLETKEEVLNAFLFILRQIKQHDDGRYFLHGLDGTTLQIPLDAANGFFASQVLDWLKPQFFYEEGDLIREFLERIGKPTLIYRRLGAVNATKVDDQIVWNYWNKLLQDVWTGQAAAVETVSFGNLETWLGKAFGEANVTRLTGGVNGDAFGVWDEATGQQLFVKRVKSTVGHTTPSDATLSYALTNWLADQLGGIITVPPTRVVSLNESDTVAVMPLIGESSPWFQLDHNAFEIDYEPARRVYMFDLLSGESDNHLGNVLMDDYSNGSVEILIDREMSFGFYTKGTRYEVPQKDGPMLVMNEIMGNLWYEADDVGSRVDRPVKLVRVTQAEFESLTGVPEFDPLVKGPYGNVTATTFDLDGHNFPLALMNSGPRPARLSVTGDPLAEMDVAIPAGRVGWYIDNGRLQFKTSISPTDTELAFIQRLLDPTQQDALRQEIADALQDGLKYVNPQGVIWNDIEEVWGVLEHLNLGANEGVGGAADYALIFMQQRVSRFVDGAVINLSGTQSSVVNARGDVFRIGESIKVRHIDTGEPIEGLIINIGEDTRGNKVIHWVTDVGRGLDDPQTNLIETFNPELYTLGGTISEDEIALATRIASETIEGFQSPLVHVEVDLDSFLLQRPRLNSLGLPIGMEDSRVTVEYVGKATDTIRVVDTTGTSVTLPTDRLVSIQGQEIIESVLSEIPAEFRPSKVRIHLNGLKTEDGRPVFGFYDPETDELHASLAQIFPWGIEQIGDNFVAFKLPEGVSANQAYGKLDWAPFVQLIQHEMGHAYQVRREAQQRSVIVTAVVSDLIKTYGDDVTRADLNTAIRVDGLVDGIDVTKYVDEFDALTQVRADLIEDITYTNWAQSVQDLFDEAELPTWIERAYAGVTRGDPDALEEVFADLYSKLSDYGGVPVRDARRQVAKELGVDPLLINRLFNIIPPEPPASWAVESNEFRQWLVGSIKSDGLIQSRRNRSQLWQKLGDVDITEAAAGARAGGYTVDIDGTIPSSGISVALSQFEEIIPNADKLSDKQLEDVITAYFVRQRELVTGSTELKYGLWLDEEDGSLYLDVVRLFDDELDAANFGFVERQKSMYSFDKEQVIGLLDDEPDIAGWMSRHYPDDPIEEYVAKYRRVGAVRTERNSGTLVEEIRGADGEFLPISLEAFEPDKQERLIASLDDYYYRPTKKEISALKKLSDEELTSEGVKRFTKMSKADVVDYLVGEEVTFFEGVAAKEVADVAAKKLGVSVTGKTKVAKLAEIEQAVRDQLKSQTVAKLREQARQLNIERYSKMNREELVLSIGILRANADQPRLTQALIKERLTNILRRFEELENSGTLTTEQLTNVHTKQEFKTLRGKYRFYVPWRDELLNIATENGVSAPMVIAGAARMSAGLLAEANLYAARLAAELVSENSGLGHRLTASEVREIKRWLGETLDAEDGQAYRYLKEFKKPERAQEFVDIAASITEGAYLNAYDPVAGAYIWHVITIMRSQGLGANGKGYSLSTKYGFPQFQIALAGMQGRLSLNEVLGDSKVRSFYNNILDPENIAGVGDVTVDFHMTDMALNGVAAGGKLAYKGDEPRIYGVGAGLRPIIGDTVRELFNEGWGERVGADTPAELQEILWGIWRDGKDWGLWGELREVLDK